MSDADWAYVILIAAAFAWSLRHAWRKAAPPTYLPNHALTAEMLATCEELSARSTLMAEEAAVALADGDILLARQILDHARGQNAASQRMLEVIKGHVA